MLYVDHVRRDMGVGARSGFHSGLAERSTGAVSEWTIVG
jgi:hypothetical protein